MSIQKTGDTPKRRGKEVEGGYIPPPPPRPPRRNPKPKKSK